MCKYSYVARVKCYPTPPPTSSNQRSSDWCAVDRCNQCLNYAEKYLISKRQVAGHTHQLWFYASNGYAIRKPLVNMEFNYLLRNLIATQVSTYMCVCTRVCVIEFIQIEWGKCANSCFQWCTKRKRTNILHMRIKLKILRLLLVSSELLGALIATALIGSLA